MYEGYYSFRRWHNTVLDDAIKRYDNWTSAYGVCIDDGYNSTELGKIGEKMIKVGVPADKVFTHFIAMGSPDKKNKTLYSKNRELNLQALFLLA